jgi:hypothetical protein
MGGFLPHLSYKLLISFVSLSNSSESGLFNGLQRIQIKNFQSFLLAAECAARSSASPRRDQPPCRDCLYGALLSLTPFVACLSIPILGIKVPPLLV